MAKYITKKEIKGAEITIFVEWLLQDINAKGDINGRYFSSWWFDTAHSAEDTHAMNEIMWGLAVNYAKENGVAWFNNGTEVMMRLDEVAQYIAKKLNTWSGAVIRWMKGMKYYHYGVDVCDNFGLNSLYLKKR